MLLYSAQTERGPRDDDGEDIDRGTVYRERNRSQDQVFALASADEMTIQVTMRRTLEGVAGIGDGKEDTKNDLQGDKTKPRGSTLSRA